MAKSSPIDFFLETVKTQGIAVSSVKDGTIVMFKVSHMKELVERYEDSENITIFVKQPEFKN